MRRGERFVLWALCVLAFFLLLPALIEGPEDISPKPMGKPTAALLFTLPIYMERPVGDQGTPLRLGYPEGTVMTVNLAMPRPDVRGDANGHPLSESTYIKAVYQAFRMEERCG